MRINLFVWGVFLLYFVGSSSQAQVTIDASKITCDLRPPAGVEMWWALR
jgi:hypothetical protein